MVCEDMKKGDLTAFTIEMYTRPVPEREGHMRSFRMHPKGK